MFWKRAITSFSILTFLLFTGCSLPGGLVLSTIPPSNQPESNTSMQTQIALSVAQTIVAQTVAAMNGADTSQEQGQPVNTPEFTFTPSFTPTITLTDTPNSLTVSVSVETNCRTGPGIPYDVLAVLAVGQTAEVIGKYTPGNYWIIHPPSNPVITCWLWGEYATISGVTSGLTSYTPPPTPTPKYTATPEASFQISFSEVLHCVTVMYGINIKITNNGSITWESNRIRVTDLVTSETQNTTRDSFPRYDPCSETSYGTNLEPGEVGYTYYGLLGNPSGHNVQADVRVCSQDGLTGICLDKTITFTP